MIATNPDHLPPAPAGRRGWPWTEASRPLSPTLPDGSPWPRMSIVTPSYNQGEYLEETIRSVLLQGYPALEYLIIDGGSTDGSREIIEKYSPWLTYWVSEPDRGQYHAINKGFARASGGIMAWLNSDDKYVANALGVVAEVIWQFSEAEWVTSLRPMIWYSGGGGRQCRRLQGYCREGFRRAEYLEGLGHFKSAWIQQESTFWRRSLWESAGGLVDESLKLAGDFELWTRFYEHSELYGIDHRLGGNRRHGNQKTALDWTRYVEEAKEVFARRGGRANGWLTALARVFVTRLPRFARRPFMALGLAHPGKIIVRDRRSHGWRMEISTV